VLMPLGVYPARQDLHYEFSVRTSSSAQLIYMLFIVLYGYTDAQHRLVLHPLLPGSMLVSSR